MAMPPKKKYKTRPSKVAQAAAEQAAMKKIMNISILLLVLPLLVVGVRQVNPGIFFVAQGLVVERFGSKAGAARAYEKAFEANPEKGINALIDAVRLYEYEENWEMVDELSRKIIEANQADTEQKAIARFFQARRAYEMGRYEDALLLATQAQPNIKKRLYEYRVWIMIGAAGTKLAGGDDNNFKKAWDALDTSIRLRRMFAAEARFYMGQLYEAWKGQTAAAMDEYDYGLSQQPDPKMRKKLLDAKSRLVTK